MRALLSCFSWFWENLIRKTSPLVLGKILSVFVTILAADDKYPVEDWENLQLPIQMQLSEKRKTFLEFFVPFLDSTSKFKHFEKKRWWSWLMYFRNYRLWKTSSDHSVRTPVSEHALTVKMLKCPEYLKNLHESTFVMSFHHFETSRFGN